jgi:hypothetical protein
MRLSEEQSRRLLRTHGVYLSDVCDRCGTVIGPIRWTIRGERGLWCSRGCRDGVYHKLGICRGCGTSLVGKKRGAMYCSRTCRMRKIRREVKDCANIVNTPVVNKGLADAILGFWLWG